MKTKKIYYITITAKEGTKHTQYLRRSELHLIPQILRENKSINIENCEVSIDKYKLIFNL